MMKRLALSGGILLLMAAVCFASDVPVNDIPKSDGFISRWLVLGPFKDPEIKGAEIGDVTRAGYDTDYLSSLGGEAKATIDSSTTIQTPDGRVGPPYPVTVDHRGMVCLDPLFGVNVPLLVSYSFCRVRSDSDQTVYAHFGSDDAAKVYVNGELAFSVWVEHRWARRDQNHFQVKLHKGFNDFLVKVDNRREDTEFVLELYEEPYEKVRFAERLKGLVVRPLSAKNTGTGPFAFVVEFDPHTFLYTPTAKVSVETPDGRVLTTLETPVGRPAAVDVPSDAGQVVFLNASVADFNGRALSGSGAVVRGDWKAARADLSARLRALQSSAPKGMSDLVRRRHLALARYYSYLLSLMWNQDEYTVYSLLKRGATQYTILPELARVVAAVEAGNDMLTAQRGSFRAAYISQADSSPQPYVINVPKDYDASRPWPLIVNLHGLGGTSGDPSELEGRADAITVRPDGRGQANWWRNLAERDCLDVIADARAAYNIDPARIYLSGASMGGFGTWEIASHHPDLFAAVVAFCGGAGSAPIENLINVPIVAFHDKADWGVPSDNSRWSIRLLQQWGYPATLRESEGFGHDAPAGAKAVGFDADAWLLTHRRPDAPSTVIYTARDVTEGKAYWASVTDFDSPSRPATVRAAAREGNELSVQAKNAQALSFDLLPQLFDRKSPLSITVGNNLLRVDAPLPEAIRLESSANVWRLASVRALAAPKVRPYEAGSLSNLHRGEPLLIVRGTSGGDALVAAMAQLAKDLSCHTQSRRPMDFPSIPVKRDSEVTDADMQRSNLILIGGPSQNSVTAKLAPRLIVQEEDERVILDGKLRFVMKGRGYGLFCYNPLAPQRLVYVLSSPSPKFYSLDVSPVPEALDEDNTIDFALVDVKPRRFVRCIAWGGDWKPAKRFFSSSQLPYAFSKDGYEWDLISDSMLRAADADFALCPLFSKEEAAKPSNIDVGNMTWADYENLISAHHEVILAAEVSGDALLAIERIAKSKCGLHFVPDMIPVDVEASKVYRIVMPAGIMEDLDSNRQQNLDTIHFVTYDWIGSIRRRLNGK